MLASSQQAGLSASWELDLWGKLRREREAALADVSASERARDALRLSLGSQVAKTLFPAGQLTMHSWPVPKPRWAAASRH